MSSSVPPENGIEIVKTVLAIRDLCTQKMSQALETIFEGDTVKSFSKIQRIISDSFLTQK